MTEFSDPEIYRTVLQTMHMAILLVDQKRRIRFWNEGAERITGYLSQDVVGRFQRGHFLAESEELNGSDENECNSADPIGLAFRDGKASLTEGSILHKDGYRVPITLRTIPIRNSHGSVIGAAESFYRNQTASEWSKRQVGLAEFGCLDELIGVPPQIYMETQIREKLTTFAEHHIPFGILIVQVDQLDQFRARRGSEVVGSILRVVAQTVENALRPTDLLGCWSENQLLAVLPECREPDVMHMGDKVRRLVAQSEILWWGEKFSVACVFGGAGCRAGDTWKLIVARAEKSLQEFVARRGSGVITRP